MRKYVASIGDLVDSKRILNRKTVQQKLKQALTNINEKYAPDIAAKFTITLGDEFQGLLNNKSKIIQIINELEIAMLPNETRFGIGIGDISTEIIFDNSSEIDGSAYHRARKMIETIEQRKSQYPKIDSHIMICTNDTPSSIDDLINSTFTVCTALKSKWTERQKEIIQAYFVNEQNQYKTASALGIGQPSVNKALNNAKFYAYLSAIKTVNSFLNQ